MKKRIGAILLTICMLVGLLPTAALAAETGYLVTLNYDTSLCTVTVTDCNDSDATVENGGYLTPGSNGNASAIFEIENIAKGYRIAKVLLNGVDYTVDFITGAYGGIAQSVISKDVTLSVTLEEIPALPVLESIEVYADGTYTEVLSTDLTLTEATQIYVKGTYADGGEYPEYTARGHMEYTMDGTTWNWTQWGGGYWYFLLNSTFYTDFNPLEDRYDFRICIEPDGLYCTGDTFYSEVYHVNGGVGACSHSWDEGSVTTAPTCTQPGEKTYTCSKCQTTRTEEVEATGHTEVTDAAVAATCTATGLTEGKHCSVCNAVLVTQEIAPAKGHTSTESDCTKPDVCGVCGEVIRTAGTHVCTYTASGAVLTETCGSCDHTATATLSVSGGPFSYTGTAITPASVAYGDGWQSGNLTITYSGNTLAGTATASVTLGGATASVTFTISPAALTVKPKDVTIYVGDALPTQLELAYTGLMNGDTLTPAGTPAFTLKHGDVELADSKTAGTYTILWTNPDEITFDNANYGVTKETSGTLTIANRPSSGSSGGSAAVTPDEPEITTGGGTTVAEIETEVTTSGTTSKAAVSQDALDQAIQAAESAAGQTNTHAAVEIVVDTPAKATEVKVDLPAEGLENFADSEAQSLTISSGVGTVTISPEAAASIAEQAQGDTVTVTISEVTQPEKTLNERQLAAVGDAPVYDLSVTSNGKYITGFDGGLITVSLPYTLKADEEPNGVVAYYVDDLGNIQRVRAMYDVKTQSIIFTTNHFSFYTVRYESDAAAAARFTDVPFNAYYQSAVGWAVNHGVTSGVTETTFAPNAACTRAQAVTFLWRAAGSPEPQDSVNPFTDVKADAYYYNAVLWAIEQGITKGTSDTTFSPNATCTRAQIVTFLWRSQKSPASDSVNPFTDVAADAYYNSAVLWAAENGITGGTSATTFSPNNDCTRAQIVTFLYRCLGEE